MALNCCRQKWGLSDNLLQKKQETLSIVLMHSSQTGAFFVEEASTIITDGRGCAKANRFGTTWTAFDCIQLYVDR